MRGFVFIDGSNFYFKLKQLSGGIGHKVNLLDFDFKAFASWLVQPQELSGVRYYIGGSQACIDRSSSIPRPSAKRAKSAIEASTMCSALETTRVRRRNRA